MKYLSLIVGLLISFNCIIGQSQVDSLVSIGITYHDNREYDKAIDIYREALKIEPQSPLVNYEIAITYMYAKEYKKSIKHCDKVIELNDQHLSQAYTTKGSCLDNLGKTQQAIETYEEALEKFDADYLLHYNLGFTLYNQKDYANAEEHFLAALELNPNHATSHLLLGITKSEQNKRVQSLLSLYYFLFLEPNTARSDIAYALLQQQLVGSVEKDATEPKNITINISSDMTDTDYGAADMMLSMLEASRTIEENKIKSEDELFIESTTSFFKILGELKKKKNKDFWWTYYVPFFYDIARSEHIDTYCYYISWHSNERAKEWISNNDNKFEDFKNWLQEE